MARSLPSSSASCARRSPTGGREIDTQGDAFFFAFPTAKEAVTAALVGPRALAGHEWTEGNEVVKRSTSATHPAVSPSARASSGSL